MNVESAARDVADRLAAHGLTLRGTTLVTAESDGLSAGPNHGARVVWLIGNAGGAFWPAFAAWRRRQPVDLANPLDAWSRAIIDGVAAAVGARAVYPSDRPYLPFQQWAMRAERLRPSPLGVLMHPVYGLWHAYRGALLFDRELDLPAVAEPIHLCDTCPGKPCLKACPVGAHSSAGFAYSDCLSHVRAPAGEPCRSAGCLDRNACPYGTAYRYTAEQQAFHMDAFAR